MSTAVSTLDFDTVISASPSDVSFTPNAKETRMTTPLTVLRTFVMALLILAGSLGAVFVSPAQDAWAQTARYGLWQQDGCYYIWGGPTQGFQRTTTCTSTNNVGWGKENGVDILYAHDGTTWRPQAVFMPPTSQSPQGTLAVIFTDGHVFFYQYHAGYWLHTAQDNGVTYLETAGGWVNNAQGTQSTQSAESDYWSHMVRMSELRGVDIMLQPSCNFSYNGCAP